jgi:hypothetical protein
VDDTCSKSLYYGVCPFCIDLVFIEGYGLGVRGIVVRLPAGAEDLALLQIIQTGSGAHLQILYESFEFCRLTGT